MKTNDLIKKLTMLTIPYLQMDKDINIGMWRLCF